MSLALYDKSTLYCYYLKYSILYGFWEACHLQFKAINGHILEKREKWKKNMLCNKRVGILECKSSKFNQ